MTLIRDEMNFDVAAREALLNAAFGACRFAKTSERLRAGRLPAEGLAFSAVDDDGKLLGTVRLWRVKAGAAGDALLLGPLAVAAEAQGQGLGAALMRHAINTARVLGHTAILLVGDAPYYARFGFSPALTAGLSLPGPVDRARFLALELTPGSLGRARGLVTPMGDMATSTQRAA